MLIKEMHKYFFIWFFLLFVINTNAQTILKLTDSLYNKGKNEIDTLTMPINKYIGDSTIIKKETPRFIRDSRNKYFSSLKQKDFSTEDIRSISDAFVYLPFAFVQDLGHFGQPGEQMFYGLGFGNISYSRDEIYLNNRWQNSFNLNRLSNEAIDSITITPITKGFLYNPQNNPVSVKINNYFDFPKRAITRLKFFQASFDEGFVNVLFHTPVTEKISFGFDVSNSAIDSRFINSDYESWKISGEVNYLVNNKLNIKASYFFTYDTLALFGGLDTNKMLNENFSKVLYEIVNGKSSRYQLTSTNNASIKILSRLFPNSVTELIFYYNTVSQKFRQNHETAVAYIPTIIDDNNYSTAGIYLKNYYSQPYFSLDIIGNYEITKFDMDINNVKLTQNVLTVSGELKLLNKFKYFVPSVFGKISNYNKTLCKNKNETLLGFGGDITGEVNDGISYYVGFSWFQQQNILFNNFLAISENNINSASDNHALEFGVVFSQEKFSGKLAYFSYKANNRAIPYIPDNSTDTLLINEYSAYHNMDIVNKGVGLSFNYKFWKILLSGGVSYCFSSKKERVYASPDFSIAGKIYYLDHLFNNNLYLKAGINYRIASEQNPFVHDFEKSRQITERLTPLVHYTVVPSTYQINLYAAGTIQERATIFITLENVLDNAYYIVPYYFKQPVTLKFGVNWLLFD
jgi:hypothetical protein